MGLNGFDIFLFTKWFERKSSLLAFRMGGVGFGSVFASAIGFLVVLVDYGYFGL